MFDWLFGDGGKGRDQQQKALEDMAIQNAYNREMANAMSSISADPANADLMSALTKADPNFMNNWNNQAMGLRSQANIGGQDYESAQKELEALDKKNRYNYFGNGMLGALLNPIGQTVSAGVDLASGNYGKNDRDVLSDIGALGETALTFIPGLGLAGKGGKALTSVKGMAGMGAGFGAMDALRQGGSDVQFGDILSQAGMGAAFGGGIGWGAGKAGNFLRNRGASEITGKYLADPANANAAKGFLEGGLVGNLKNQVAKQPGFLGDYGGLYQNALGSLMPKSTIGRLGLGGAGLYGGMRLLGGGGGEQPQAGYDPYELQAQGAGSYGYGGM